MIKHLRIDNRLIHGQVAVVWQKYIDAKAIIVCNDKVAGDPIQKMALPLAARGSKVLVLSIADMLAYEKEHPDESLSPRTPWISCAPAYRLKASTWATRRPSKALSM